MYRIAAGGYSWSWPQKRSENLICSLSLQDRLQIIIMLDIFVKYGNDINSSKQLSSIIEYAKPLLQFCICVNHLLLHVALCMCCYSLLVYCSLFVYFVLYFGLIFNYLFLAK